jgi:hypothetical protein
MPAFFFVSDDIFLLIFPRLKVNTYWNQILEILKIMNPLELEGDTDSQRAENREFKAESEFIKTQLEPFLEPMIAEVILNKPDDPYHFMLKWLEVNGPKVKARMIKGHTQFFQPI